MCFIQFLDARDDRGVSQRIGRLGTRTQRSRRSATLHRASQAAGSGSRSDQSLRIIKLVCFVCYCRSKQLEIVRGNSREYFRQLIARQAILPGHQSADQRAIISQHRQIASLIEGGG